MCLRCVQCALSNLKSLVLVRRFSHERQHGDRVFSQPSSSNCNNQRGEYCSAVNSILPAQKEHTGQPWICLPTVIKMIVFLARRASRRDRHRSRILAYWNHPTRTTTTTCLRPHRLILAMTRTRWRRSTMTMTTRGGGGWIIGKREERRGGEGKGKGREMGEERDEAAGTHLN